MRVGRAADLVDDTLRKSSDIDVLGDAPGVDGRRQHSRSALDSPRQKHLRGSSFRTAWRSRRSPDRRAVAVGARAPAVRTPAGRCPRIDRVSAGPTAVVRMRLRLDDRGLDPGASEYSARAIDRCRTGLLLRKVPTSTRDSIAAQVSSSLTPSSSMTAPCESRGSWSSPGWNANGVCIDTRLGRVQSESVQAGLQGWLYPLLAMVVVPELRGDEQVLAADGAGGEQIL